MPVVKTGCVVYTNIQPVVKRVVKPVCQTGLTTGWTTVLNEQTVRSTGCQTGLCNRFDNRLYTRYSRFVKPVVKGV